MAMFFEIWGVFWVFLFEFIRVRIFGEKIDSRFEIKINRNRRGFRLFRGDVLFLDITLLFFVVGDILHTIHYFSQVRFDNSATDYDLVDQRIHL